VFANNLLWCLPWSETLRRRDRRVLFHRWLLLLYFRFSSFIFSATALEDRK
jgi:hypothetical protein